MGMTSPSSFVKLLSVVLLRLEPNRERAIAGPGLVIIHSSLVCEARCFLYRESSLMSLSISSDMTEVGPSPTSFSILSETLDPDSHLSKDTN